MQTQILSFLFDTFKSERTHIIIKTKYRSDLYLVLLCGRLNIDLVYIYPFIWMAKYRSVLYLSFYMKH